MRVDLGCKNWIPLTFALITADTKPDPARFPGYAYPVLPLQERHRQAKRILCRLVNEIRSSESDPGISVFDFNHIYRNFMSEIIWI